MREDGGIINSEIDNRRERWRKTGEIEKRREEDGGRRKGEIEKRKGQREKERLNKGERKSMVTVGKATKIR